MNRGARAGFDAEWSPRMGAFRSGVKRKSIRSSVEKAPLLFSGAHELCRRAEVGCSRLRQTACEADLAPGGFGLGSTLGRAVILRCAASVSLAFFGVRRASEIAGRRTSRWTGRRSGGGKGSLPEE